MRKSIGRSESGRTGVNSKIMIKKTIIVVDDNLMHLEMCKKALKGLYEVYPASSAKEMFGILAHIIPTFIILDVSMPVVDGYCAIKALKTHNDYKDIPVIFLSAMDDAKSEMEGLDLGAVDYIHKPFISDLLVKRIETHAKIIDSKKELLMINKSIEELLTPAANETKLHREAEEEAIRYLLLKDELLSQMGHELRAPLSAIIEMTEAAIQSNDMAEIRHCLGKVDVETRLILEILDDTLNVSV
jgi:PleD family two-component response regulator